MKINYTIALAHIPHTIHHLAYISNKTINLLFSKRIHSTVLPRLEIYAILPSRYVQEDIGLFHQKLSTPLVSIGIIRGYSV